MAALLSLTIFGVSFTIGLAAMALVGRRVSLGNLLVSPVCGATLIVLPTLMLNKFGLAVGAFASPLVVLELAFAAAILAWRRPAISWKALAVFGGIAIVAFAFTDRPLFEFGFNWLSFSADDMANYALGADRFMRVGYYEPPHLSPGHSLLTDVDVGYWAIYAVAGERSGVELLLAVVASLSHISTIEAFMPTIVAGHLTLVWAAGALVARLTSRLLVSAGVSLAVSVSALTSFGVLYQLFAQVFGLAAFCFCLVIWTDRRFLGARVGRGWRVIVLATLASSAVVVFYPELLTMLAASIVVFVLYSAWRQAVDLRRAALSLGLAIAMTAILLNLHLLTMLVLVHGRLQQGLFPSGSKGAYLFPYYLLPSGLANFWGILPVASFPPDPWISIAIGVSLALTLAGVTAILVASWQRSPAAIAAAVMLALIIGLALGRADFGLFRVASYLQPLTFASIAEGVRGIYRMHLLGRRASAKAAALVVIVFSLFGLWTQQVYVNMSRDLPTAPTSGAVEVPHASSDHLVDQLKKISHERARGTIGLDTTNITLQKIEALFEKGHPLLFSVGELRYNILQVSKERRPPFFRGNFDGLAALVRRFSTIMRGEEQFASFDYGTAREQSRATFHATHTRGVIQWILASTKRQTILNRSTIAAPGEDVILRPVSAIRNYLRFQITSLGSIPNTSLEFITKTSTDRSMVSVYRPEPDYFFKDASMSALGRYLLFDVVAPSPKLHLILNVTASLAGGGRNGLPPARVLGAEDVRFGFTGDGSARLVSPAVSPRMIDGNAYVGLDLGRDGQLFASQKTGLMKLYGEDIVLDSRKVVLFGRDISAISDGEYQRWRAPHTLSAFPNDLANPELEYSGIYEEGWLSDDVFLRLSGGGSRRRLRIVGYIPLIRDDAFSTDCGIAIDGRQVTRKMLGVGDFEIVSYLSIPPGKHTIRLHFSRSQKLPYPDSRKVTAHVVSIGFDSL